MLLICSDYRQWLRQHWRQRSDARHPFFERTLDRRWLTVKPILVSCRIASPSRRHITEFSKHGKFYLELTKFHENSSSGYRIVLCKRKGGTDKTDVTKPTVAFRNFANASKNETRYNFKVRAIIKRFRLWSFLLCSTVNLKLNFTCPFTWGRIFICHI
jgi:hypothetical protein